MNQDDKKIIKKIRIVAIPKDKEASFIAASGVKIKCCSTEEWSQSLFKIKGYSQSENFVQLLKTIANPIRFRILMILLEREWACNCEFELAFNEHQTLISHHLRNLREAHLIIASKKGQWNFYRIRDEARAFIKAIRDTLIEKSSHITPP